MAPKRKTSKGVQQVVASMTNVRKRASPRRTAQRRVQRVVDTTKVAQRKTSATTSPGASFVAEEAIQRITREVTDNIKAHVDDRLANLISHPQQQTATNLSPVASTSQQHTHELSIPSLATSTSQLGYQELVDQAVDMATSALVGNGVLERKVCADQDNSCVNLIEKFPDMRFKYPSFAWERCPKSTGLCTDSDVTGQKSCQSSTPSAACAICLDPGAVVNAKKVKGGDKITVGEYFEHTCSVGYTLVGGNLKRACLPSKKLTGKTPVCQDINLVPTKVNDVSIRKRSKVMLQNKVYTGDNAYLRIKKSGEIYEWEFYSHMNGTIALQVWRRKNMSFTLIGQNVVHNARDDRLRRIIIPPNSRIAVKPNDLIGFYFVGVSSGGVTVDGCNQYMEPEGMKIFSSSSKYPDVSSFSVNQTIEFNAETYCSIFSLNAVVGPKK